MKKHKVNFIFIAIIIGIMLITNGVDASTGPVDYYKGGINKNLKAIYGGDDGWYVPKDD